MRKAIFSGFFCLLLAFAAQAQNKPTQGGLEAVGAGGKALGACPLKQTSVKAEISGFLSRVKVVQEFENNFAEKIEAVYVFPLPNNAAVDDMTMKIGERTIRGLIKKREEAKEIYEAAKSNGQIASLLDQERTNIFTQAVANILPGEKVTIEISYVETLKYENGSYEFVFPMVVGPRYIPGNPTGRQSGGFAPDTDKVPDGSRITPRVAETRAGHDISIEVSLDAGVPLDAVESKTHQIDSAMLSANSYRVKLKSEKTIPNKDFILRYDVAGKRIEDAVLMHRNGGGGYFSLILQPPDDPRPQDVTPKEIVFVLDTSGSMSGFPIEKAKESMKMALDGLNPQDTFNLITFAGDTSVLFEKPVPASADNLKKARAFLESRQGGGGTEMMKAIKTALDPSDSQQHVRIVCFMTDGYIGNEAEILAEIQRHPNARVFSFGIGSSVNRMLLDKMAAEGRGEVEYVALNDDGSAAARRFHERVRSPLLTDISIDFGGLEVADVYPKRVNDLFSAKPVLIHGRFTKPGNGTIKLKGKSFGRETVREIPVNFPESEARHDVLAVLWARQRIDDLTAQDYENKKPEIREQITNLGLEFRLMTQYTSFVAVEERVVTDGGSPRRIEVPVEMPEGVSREGVFGAENESTDYNMSLKMPSAPYSIQNSPAKRKIRVGNSYPRPVATPRRDAAIDKTTLSKDEDAKTFDNPVDAAQIKAKALPKPVFPAGSRATGAVNVEVALDAGGNVTAAKAVAGEKSLSEAAVAAARGARFEIPQSGFEIKQITGVLVYTFGKDKSVAVSQLQNVRAEIKPNKYHSAIKALVERLKTGGAASVDEAKFVRDGKADVVVRLKALTPAAVDELKKIGFEVLTEMPSANAVVGRVEIEKLAALAELDRVTFVSPQNR
ncbi:MAG TPA: VIT domain-containing protein [Pyrinomonadaceae bacterium]|jgi:Ca-activated chloride channel family protein